MESCDGFFDDLLPVPVNPLEPAPRIRRLSSVASLKSSESLPSLAAHAAAQQSPFPPRVVVISGDATTRQLVTAMLASEAPQSSSIASFPSLEECSAAGGPVDAILIHVGPRQPFSGDTAALPRGPDGTTGFVIIGDIDPDVEEAIHSSTNGWCETVRSVVVCLPRWFAAPPMMPPSFHLHRQQASHDARCIAAPELTHALHLRSFRPALLLPADPHADPPRRAHPPAEIGVPGGADGERLRLLRRSRRRWQLFGAANQPRSAVRALFSPFISGFPLSRAAAD